MAREIRVTLIDDLDGSEATQTVEFSFAGSTYTIDLNEANAAKLEAALKPYIEKGEKVRGRRAVAAARRTPQARKGGTAEIRSWARENGFDVSDRGRIPADVLTAYEAAH